jgi:putative aldouronate transport system permease protein
MTGEQGLPTLPPHGSGLVRKLQRQKYLLAMLAPGFLLVLVFSYVPLFGWIMAFKDYALGKSIISARWVGLVHFREFFFDTADALYVIRNTVVLNILYMVLELFIACAFAILLNEVFSTRLKRLVQSFTFFPFFISWTLCYSIFYVFLSEQGVLNDILVSLGVVARGKRILFLSSPTWAWPTIITVSIWKYTGYNAVIFIASLAGIPQEQYESAEIDGAGRRAKIAYVTIPGLMPTMLVLLLMNIGWIFSSNFEQYFLFANIVNRRYLEVFDLYIYNFGLKLGDYPYATAVGIVKSLASLLTLVIANAISRRLNGRSLI